MNPKKGPSHPNRRFESSKKSEKNQNSAKKSKRKFTKKIQKLDIKLSRIVEKLREIVEKSINFINIAIQRKFQEKITQKRAEKAILILKNYRPKIIN